MKDPILAVKDNKELMNLLETEKDEEEIYRLKRQGSPMAKVILAHKFGVGDCECSVCGI